MATAPGQPIQEQQSQETPEGAPPIVQQEQQV
jgi:hypothetical protein